MNKEKKFQKAVMRLIANYQHELRVDSVKRGIAAAKARKVQQ